MIKTFKMKILWKLHLKILQVIILLHLVNKVNNTPSHQRPSLKVNFCKDNQFLVSTIYPGLSNGYPVTIKKNLVATTEIKVKLDSGGTITFGEELDQNFDTARFTTSKDLVNNIFTFILLKDNTEFTFTVKGRFAPHHPPYIISLKINGEENCKDPDRSYFSTYSYSGIDKFWSAAPDTLCGRRRINRQYTELIVGGSASKAADWPWHSAIYRLDKGRLQYICGGTLISKFSILTAAHCVTINGQAVNPAILGVILGKYKLIGTEFASQDKEVYEIKIHDEFDHRILNNDIAILKMNSEANYNNYVQPACLWLDDCYDQLDSYAVIGTVVGWGIDQSDNLSDKLREAAMPLVPELTCIRYDPVFYNNMLNGKKFCAGYTNGTTACNGDSGGGFVVFVRDSNAPFYGYSQDQRPGAWYVKGIVSVALARHGDNICDPRAYTVFTDVAKYRDWILNNM